MRELRAADRDIHQVRHFFFQLQTDAAIARKLDAIEHPHVELFGRRCLSHHKRGRRLLLGDSIVGYHLDDLGLDPVPLQLVLFLTQIGDSHLFSHGSLCNRRRRLRKNNPPTLHLIHRRSSDIDRLPRPVHADNNVDVQAKLQCRFWIRFSHDSLSANP